MKDEKIRDLKSRQLSIFMFICAVLNLVLFVCVDQITKFKAVEFLKDRPSQSLIPGVLEFMYLENHGAAFSMLQDQQWFFYILTAVFLVAAVLLIRRIPKNRYYWPLLYTIGVLCAGAIGNLIDRIRLKYVIDFIYFSLIDFPVFNVADIYVTLSVIELIILVLFRYTDEDFNEIFKGKS